jgi:hypothetical protein
MVDGLLSFLIYCGLIVLTLYLHTSVLPFGSFGQPDLVLVRGGAASSAVLLIMSQPAICCRWRVGVAATEKDRKIAMKNC